MRTLLLFALSTGLVITMPVSQAAARPTRIQRVKRHLKRSLRRIKRARQERKVFDRWTRSHPQLMNFWHASQTASPGTWHLITVENALSKGHPVPAVVRQKVRRAARLRSRRTRRHLSRNVASYNKGAIELVKEDLSSLASIAHALSPKGGYRHRVEQRTSELTRKLRAAERIMSKEAPGLTREQAIAKGNPRAREAALEAHSLRSEIKRLEAGLD